MYLFNRIAFITGQLGLGGAEKQLFLLARGLLREGWQVSVINMSHQQNEYWEKPLRDIGVSVYGVAAKTSQLHRLLDVRRILQAARVSVVHSWSMHTNFYAAAGGRLSGVPLRIGSERSNHLRSRKSLGLWYDLCLWGQDAVVANSKQEGDFLCGYRPNLRVAIVPNGIETPEKQITEPEKHALRERFGLPTSVPIIGAVGRMAAGKGFSNLIKALEFLDRRRVPFSLVMVGSGPILLELERQCDLSLSKNKFLFTGAVPNPTDWYHAFDLLCMPSIHHEGMPNVIMEACAAGLPVIASQVGGIPELIEDGITGFLVKPNHIGGLADQLEKLLVDTNLRQEMGCAGREKMEREFSASKMIARMKRVYEEVSLDKGLT